jgi:putative transposase
MRLDFPGVNHKRLHRLYCATNLAVRRRKMAKRPAMERTPLNIAQCINEVWSMDFVSDSLNRPGNRGGPLG